MGSVEAANLSRPSLNQQAEALKRLYSQQDSEALPETYVLLAKAFTCKWLATAKFAQIVAQPPGAVKLWRKQDLW